MDSLASLTDQSADFMTPGGGVCQVYEVEDVNSEDQRKKTVETVGHRVTLYLLWQVKVRSCVYSLMHYSE